MKYFERNSNHKKLKVSKAFLWERVEIGDIITILPAEENSKVKVSLNGKEPVIMSTNKMLTGLSAFEFEEINQY